MRAVGPCWINTGKPPIEDTSSAESRRSRGLSQASALPQIYAKLGYDGMRDFAPVSTVCIVQFLLTVGPLVPAEVKTVADFVGGAAPTPTAPPTARRAKGRGHTSWA